jgi:hypothetical protein
MELVIRPRAFVPAVIVTGLVVLGALGYSGSPRGKTGRPILLLPDVRAVEVYRRAVVRWVHTWQILADDLNQALHADDGELLSRSRAAQSAFNRAVTLVQEVDATNAPAALLGLHELTVTSGAAQLEAGAAVLRWLSAPTEENYKNAEAALAQASGALKVLEASEWVASHNEAQAK